MLGDFYNGVGGKEKQDPDKAIEWYAKAEHAENPSAYGPFQIGQMYYYGYGVDVDYEKAFDAFSRAVEIYKAQENVRDSFFPDVVKLLGDMYNAGKGVEQDTEKAEEYYNWAKELTAAGA